MEHRSPPDICRAAEEEVIRIHPDARIELRAAWLWYGDVSNKLAAAHGRRRPEFWAARLDDVF